MNCPICKKALTNIRLEQTSIDVCSEGCGGIWLDRGDLSKIIQSGQDITNQLSNSKKTPTPNVGDPRHCPRNQMILMKRSYIEDQAMVDECPKCAGIWIDNLEEFLQVISDFKQKLNLNKDEAQKILEDQFLGKTDQERSQRFVGQRWHGGGGSGSLVRQKEQIGIAINNSDFFGQIIDSIKKLFK